MVRLLGTRALRACAEAEGPEQHGGSGGMGQGMGVFSREEGEATRLASGSASGARLSLRV